MCVPEQEVLQLWDSRIRTVCMHVNGIVDKVALLHPKWAADSMDEQMVH